MLGDGFEFGRDGFGDGAGTGRNGRFVRVGTGGTGSSALGPCHGNVKLYISLAHYIGVFVKVNPSLPSRAAENLTSSRPQTRPLPVPEMFKPVPK